MEDDGEGGRGGVGGGGGGGGGGRVVGGGSYVRSLYIFVSGLWTLWLWMFVCCVLCRCCDSAQAVNK